MALLSGSYLLLQNSVVQTYIISKLTEKLSQKTGARISIGKVDITFFNQLILEDMLIATQNNDTVFYSNLVTANIDTLKIRKKIISLNELSFHNNKIVVAREHDNRYNFSFILDSLSTGKRDSSTNWNISCQRFGFNKTAISFYDLTYENPKHFYVNELNLKVSRYSSHDGSTTFRVDDFSVNYNDRLNIAQLSANVDISNNQVSIQSLNLKSEKSEINDLNLLLKFDEDEPFLNKNIFFDAQLSKSILNISELGEFVPALHETNENVEISGRIFGNLNDLKGKDINLKTGKSTNANFDFYVNGIDDIETMYLFLDLKQLETTIKDITSFNIMVNGKKIQLQVPDALFNAGLLSYKGNFSGFLSDFVTYGTLHSQMGIIKTDVSVRPGQSGIYSYKGRLSTKDFNLGRLLKAKNVGRVTFNGNVDGDYTVKNKGFAGLFKGEISKLEALDYMYENIHLDGYYRDKMFDGFVNMNDSNLQFNFAGRLNISSETPAFDFTLDVDKFVPGKLHLSKEKYQGEMAFNMKANFTGNKIDNLNGVIVIDEGFYKNKNGSFLLNGMQLISVPKNSEMELTFNSDFFDIRVDGTYQFQDFVNALKSTMNKFVPALNFETPKYFRANNFDYRVVVKNLDDLTNVFVPGLRIETPFFLYGKMDSQNYDIELEGSIPGFRYNNMFFRNIFISNKATANEYVSRFKIREIMHKNGVSVFNFSVVSNIAENVLLNKIDWYANEDSTGYSSLKSYSYFSKSPETLLPKVRTDFLPSEIFLTDTIWQINPFTADFDSTTMSINNFCLFNKTQSITIDGNISKDSTDFIFADFKNIDLGYLLSSFFGENSVKGIANGSVVLSQVYDQPVIVADATIDNFVYQNQLIGNVVLINTWDDVKSELETHLEIIKNNKKSLLAYGTYQRTTNALDYTLKADSLPLKLLETVLTDVLTDFSGSTTGEIKISGTPGKILMTGASKVDNGSFIVDYTRTKYFVNDWVYFKSDTILFQNLNFTDNNKNQGKLNGILVHDNFSNMLYDLTIVSPKIKALSTTIKDNQLFYGDVYANGRLKIYGRGLKVTLSGSLTTLPGTNVNISMEYENAIEQYDFIEFINTLESPSNDMFFYNPPKSDLTISLNIEVTPDAKTQLIYNSQIGDIIKGEGEGILLFEMNKYGDITLSGDYTVTKGEYLFTLQNILSKRFTIAPGGKIIWSGDPYNATVDLTAIYNLKTSLSDLLVNNYNTANYLYQRIPVECIILLTDELINPTINFKINFPEENESVKNELQQFFNTEEEINKQILSLIVLGKFYTPEYMRGQYESQTPNMIGNTASELFSNQLSNWLSQISKNVDIGFKYRPGNSITNDELELALSTQIFNDRVLLNGNIGNNVNPESKNSSQIVGDVDIRVKLTPNGKIQFKAYNHSNNDIIYEIAPYTQGIGFSFKEEYNSFAELVQKIGKVFKKKSGNN